MAAGWFDLLPTMLCTVAAMLLGRPAALPDHPGGCWDSQEGKQRRHPGAVQPPPLLAIDA